MKEFTTKNGKKFGFVIKTFMVDGVEWATVKISSGFRFVNSTIKVSEINIEE